MQKHDEKSGKISEASFRRIGDMYEYEEQTFYVYPTMQPGQVLIRHTVMTPPILITWSSRQRKYFQISKGDGYVPMSTSAPVLVRYMIFADIKPRPGHVFPVIMAFSGSDNRFSRRVNLYGRELSSFPVCYTSEIGHQASNEEVTS